MFFIPYHLVVQKYGLRHTCLLSILLLNGYVLLYFEAKSTQINIGKKLTYHIKWRIILRTKNC